MGKRVFFLCTLFLVSLKANMFNIDKAFSQLEKKLDLSQITKEKNSGITIVYTRRDLENLNIRYLHEILKKTPIGFRRSRYGLVDPFSNGYSFVPLGSIPVEIFIDDVEISSGSYHNSVSLVGDLLLSFVDHIEIYIQNPSLKIIQEPSFMIIKLYSKDPHRESPLLLEGVSTKENQSLSFESAIKDLYIYGGSELQKSERLRRDHLDSRDKIIVASYKKGGHHWNLFGFSRRERGFLGPSFAQLPKTSWIKTDYLQLGYHYKKRDQLVKLGLHFLSNHTFYENNPFLFYVIGHSFRKLDVKSNDFLAELLYQKEIHIKRNELLYGFKYRYKKFHYDHILFDTFSAPPSSFTKQHILSLFFQNDYFIKDNFILNMGASISSVINQSETKDYHPLLLRAGFTYTPLSSFTYKGQYSHMEIYPDPYLLHSIYVSEKGIDLVRGDNFLFQVDYDISSFQNFKFAGGYFTSLNYILPNRKAQVESIDQRLFEHYLSLEYTLEYKPFQNISFRYFFQRIRNVPRKNHVFLHNFSLDHQQDFGKWIFSQSFLYYQKGSPLQKEDGCNVDFDIKYQLNKNIIFFLKGENIFDTSYKDSYVLIDPLKMQPTKMMKIPSIYTTFWIGFEWSF